MSVVNFIASRKGKAIATAGVAAVTLVTAGVLWETGALWEILPDRAGIAEQGPGQAGQGRFGSLTTLGSEALSALESRSPGLRIGGVALKGKGKRARALPKQRLARTSPAAVAPTERALGKIFPPPELAFNQAPLGLPLVTVPSVGTFSTPGPGGGSFVPVPPGNIIIGSNPPPPGGNPPPPGGNPPPVLSVPEPGTWLMMIVGFGLIGAALRRKPLAVAV